MKARANSSKTFSNFLCFNSNSQFPCDKHPFSSSSVGICPHCLNDRLSKLVCSDCGECRASSCSCSETLFHRSSCSAVDVGSFGRISFLIDSGEVDRRQRGSLRRSSSNCAGVKKSNRFSRIKRLFGKRRDKERHENLEFCDENSGFSDILDDKDGFGWKRNGSPNQMELDRFCNRSVFPVKERDMSETGFIELMLDSSCESKEESFSAGRSSVAFDRGVGCESEKFEILPSLRRSGVSGKGGSCRITMKERGLKQGSRSSKLWKWIFKNRAAAEDKNY